MKWRGVVFDLDGTLADSRLDFDAMRAETGCPPGTGLLEFIDHLDSEAERARAIGIIHRYEMDGARRATWIDGAESLCRQLSGSGMPIGVFTRNSREAATLMIETLGIPCKALIAREDAAAKPDPEGLLKIAAAFGMPTGQILCVGDFRYDLEAAANAGMSSCLYDPTGGSPHGVLADHVIRRFEELAPLLLGDLP